MLIFVFLWVKGLNAHEIHSEMRQVLLRDQQYTFGVRYEVCSWQRKHVVVTINATIATVDAFVQSARHVSITDIVQLTDDNL